jgi:alpha-galactosidase
MRKEESHRLLESLVIDTLEKHRIGYLKIDYNETAGYGADGAESDGEGIRQQILGVYRFLDRIRQRLPNLVIENCSSGGHRLEPSMVGRTAMSSFSDAHECLEIPIIAANLHRLILPRQSQVWAVLHSLDSPRRLIYTLAAGFLGRLCLSGEILDLKAPQWEILRNALELYRSAAPAIRDGESRRYGPPFSSYRHPTGWQAVVISGSDRTLVVVHRFAADEETVGARRRHEGDRSSTVSVPIAGEHGVPAKIAGELSEATVRAEIRGTTLQVKPLEPFSAAVYLLR